MSTNGSDVGDDHLWNRYEPSFKTSSFIIIGEECDVDHHDDGGKTVDDEKRWKGGK